MHRLGKYTASDRMSDLVCGNYHILLIMSRFGIALGFGDRTVDEVCCQSGVDTATFLAVVNLLYDEGTTTVDCRNVSLEAFLRYLHNSHDYFLQYRLPDIRRKLSEAVACGRDGIAEAIIRFFDDYAAEVHKHMMYEEETVFPYVRQLLNKVSTAMSNGELPFVSSSAVYENPYRLHIIVTSNAETDLSKLKAFDTIGGALEIEYDANHISAVEEILTE